MPEADGRWTLAVHGGAKEIAPDEEDANRQGLAEAIQAGAALLEAGGTAVEAAEAAVRVLEARPVFNAGYGSVLNNAGKVEMDASIMDGSTLAIGAIAAVQGVRHPISVARLLLDEDPILLAGDGARLFAEEKGAEVCAPEDLITPEQKEELKEAKDTVGCVAIDVHGNFVAATSTGGLTNALVGRVGDSPLPGCGFYADNAIGAVAFSGHGEGIARLALAGQVMASIERLGPEEALRKALEQMPRVGGDGGGIALTPQGDFGWWHNSPHFAVSFIRSGDNRPQIWLKKDEDQA